MSARAHLSLRFDWSLERPLETVSGRAFLVRKTCVTYFSTVRYLYYEAPLYKHDRLVITRLVIKTTVQKITTYHDISLFFVVSNIYKTLLLGYFSYQDNYFRASMIKICSNSNVNSTLFFLFSDHSNFIYKNKNIYLHIHL